mmetsp:Transcript_10200/g.21762  ORF Transcript_10200/g.21762 Transcript_10200/m.21762 type:complete len:569 (-) Transcript_10200:209-1915(-)
MGTTPLQSAAWLFALMFIPVCWWLGTVLGSLAAVVYVYRCVGHIGLLSVLAAVGLYVSEKTFGAKPKSLAGVEGTPSVIVVGAGFSGIYAAIQCKARGIPCKVYEKGSGVGGTWFHTRYPGIACDVFSHVYSFSFAMNAWWSRSFSPGPEIQKYLDGVAARFGVLDMIEFNTEVTAATWDEGAHQWTVQLKGPAGSSSTTATILLSAIGLFPAYEPRYPDLPGLRNFRGTLIHSAAWPKDVDLKGKKVAVIGTGASALQLIPEIAKEAGHLHVIQRTPPWTFPKSDFAYPRWLQLAFEYVPLLMRFHRYSLFLNIELFNNFFLMDESDSKRGPRLLRWCLGSYHRRVLAGLDLTPDQREALMPTYAIGCKRLIVTSAFHETLARKNVTLHTEAAASVEGNSVTTVSGAVADDLDVLICATGFDMLQHPSAKNIVGNNKKTLGDLYGAAPGLYMCMAAEDLPNMFVVFGPGSLIPPSCITHIERQVDYIMQVLEKMAAEGHSKVEAKGEEQKQFYKESQRRLRKTPLASCQSYYRNKDGDIWTHIPGGSWEASRSHQRPVFEHYSFSKK